MNINMIATELSHAVLLKQRAERDGRDVPKVKAPAERPATFDAHPASALVGYVDPQTARGSK